MSNRRRKLNAREALAELLKDAERLDFVGKYTTRVYVDEGGLISLHVDSRGQKNAKGFEPYLVTEKHSDLRTAIDEAMRLYKVYPDKK